MTKKTVFTACILMALFAFNMICFTGCRKKNDAEVIEFDQSQPFAINPDVQWALVTEPYTAFRSESTRESEATVYCRKGEILQVNGMAINEDHEVWYLFDKGWLSDKSVTVFSNRYKAETAALGMIE